MTLLSSSMNTLGMQALVLGMGLSSVTGGCGLILGLDRFGPETAVASGGGGEGGTAGSGGIGGSTAGGGTGGIGGSGGSDQFIPIPIRPVNGMTLTPRAYLLWEPGELPDGKTIQGYEVCHTTQGMPLIDESNECPNLKVTTKAYDVIDSLSASSTYYWKMRTAYDDATFSPYTSIQLFSTDDSLVGWWRMDTDAGNGDLIPDSSINGNNGTIVSDDIDNTVAGTGIIGQAFASDGINDYLTIQPSVSLDSVNSSSFTIEVRAMANAVSGVQTLIGRGDGVMAQSNQYYRLALVDDVLTLEHKASGIDGDLRVISGTTPVVAGTWFHAASVRDIGNSLHIYRDGIEDAPTVADNADSFDWTGFVRPLALAALVNTTTSDRLNGGLDEVALFRGAMTAAALLNNYCAAEALSGADPLPSVCTP